MKPYYEDYRGWMIFYVPMNGWTAKNYDHKNSAYIRASKDDIKYKIDKHIERFGW